MAQTNLGATRVDRAMLVQTTLNTLAMLAFAFSALTSYRWLGYGLGALTLACVGVMFVRKGVGGYIAVQLLALVGFLAAYDHEERSHLSDGLLIAAGVVIMTMLLNQARLKRLATPPGAQFANLPGARTNRRSVLSGPSIFALTTGLIAAVGVSAAADAPMWPVAVLTLALVVLYAATLIRVARIRRQKAVTPADAILDYAPEFVLYFSAPAGSTYHVEMWLPYLKSIGKRFVILIRERASLAAISEITDVPVVYCASMAALDAAIVPSVRAAFYVNNGAKNTHMVRFNRLVHIQLLHGDSDKASSYNPVTGMFDRIYVAGQAGIDRYAANGVQIPVEKFEIVGRPQVAEVAVSRRPIADIRPLTVLYAPTWTGYFNDTNYSSLEHGRTIVEELCRRGIRVIFRPHPYTDRNAATRESAADIQAFLAADRAASGRRHVFGAAAATNLSLFGCFDKADALISDVSAVASDFLYSEKPLALTDMTGGGERLAEAFPMASAVYVMRGDASNLGALLDEMLGADPLEPTRRSMKRYYLGDFPAETYADAFVRASLRDIASEKAAAGEFDHTTIDFDTDAVTVSRRPVDGDGVDPASLADEPDLVDPLAEIF